LVRNVLVDAPDVWLVGETDDALHLEAVVRDLAPDVVICGVRGREPNVDPSLVLRSSIARVLAIDPAGTGELYENKVLRRRLGALSADTLLDAVEHGWRP